MFVKLCDVLLRRDNICDLIDRLYPPRGPTLFLTRAGARHLGDSSADYLVRTHVRLIMFV